MNDPNRCPLISRELIEFLDRTFPERCPDMDWSERKVWTENGKRQLVRTLRQHFEKQQKETNLV